MNTFGFLFDEHVTPLLMNELPKAEPAIRVYAVGFPGVPPKSTPDPVLLEWIEAHDCLLVTNNRSTMPVHLPLHLAAGRHIPGIIQLPRLLNVGPVLENLLLIWQAGLPEEFRDRITYLPLR